MPGSVKRVAAAVVLALGAAPAFAQQATDYVIYQYAVGSRYLSPPSDATTLSLSGDDNTAALALPFTFTYFGTPFTACHVSTNGFMSFTTNSGAYANLTFPTSASANISAALFPYWDDLVVGPTLNPSDNGTIRTWTTGSAPDRGFVISWESVWSLNPVVTGAYGVGPFTFQIQLYESSGSVVFSYMTPSGGNWPTSGYTLGIQAPDSRYELPSAVQNSATANTGAPPNDFSFDLPKVTFTGRVLYDRYVVDELGVGATSQQNVPLARLRVEARDAAGVVTGVATTSSSGDFTLVANGIQPSVVGSVVVCSQSTACAVRAAAGGAPYSTPVALSVSYAADLSLGTLVLHEGVDAGGTGREPINIARTIQTVVDWTATRTSDAIPFLEVLYSTTSSLPTSYTAKAGTTPASMRISGAASSRDAWDVSVIRKTYGRHVLGAIAADPATTYGSAIDSVTDAQNAFAEAFGYYLNAVISGDRKYYDGVNSTTTNVLDLEDLNPNSRKGGDVAAWVAMALYDLTDAANEPWDTFAGAGAAGEQVFHVVDSLSAPVTATTFFNAWLAAGYDGPALSQNFVHHGLIPDDDDEPNDDAAHATSFAQSGIIRDHRTLNLFNDDWYKFTLAEAVGSLTVSVAFDRVRYASAQVALELRTAANAQLAVGDAVDSNSPITLTAAGVPPGDYRIRVALNGGGPVPDYTVQVFSQFAFRATALPAWTVGRPYDELSIIGGIPPYALTAPASDVAPAGLVFGGDKARVTGTPMGPASGVPINGSFTYVFPLAAQDSARPTNQVQGQQSFTLHDVVRSRFSEFVAFANAKPLDRPWPPVGGTPPYVVTIDAGALPDGVDATAGADLRFAGTPDAPGSSPCTITVTDVAGSSASMPSTAVVCVPAGAADLAAGKGACGFYFDVVRGTSVGLTIATAKKKPVRALRVAMFDVDGMRPLSVAAKIRKGKASFAKFVAPSSGRFYCVVASDDALDATSFVCVAKTAAPKAGKGAAGSPVFGGDDTLAVPVGLLSGAALTFTVKPDKKSGLHVRVAGLVDPSGNPVPLAAGDVKFKGAVLTLTKRVAASGTWTVVLGADAGPRGAFTYAYKIKQPNGVVYSAD